ncbi:sortilin-related receptor-like isoform X2 [Penaeus indicus]|uniref:sortilin-related receptor-like isoform X2 n=1 Tax=Penaeus indicus TaxID=29960 RepID=UPI00300D8A7B
MSSFKFPLVLLYLVVVFERSSSKSLIARKSSSFAYSSSPSSGTFEELRRSLNARQSALSSDLEILEKIEEEHLERCPRLKGLLDGLRETYDKISPLYETISDGLAKWKESSCTEVKTVGLRNSCRVGMFRCRGSGSCILSAWACDGEFDCDDGSDEANCGTTPQYTTSTMPSTTEEPCEDGHIRCALSRGCIPDSWQCDGEEDCPDGSDEETCAQRDCEDDEFRCGVSGICVSADFRCDGDRDCADGSDEEGCQVNACKENEFQCHEGGTCVSQDWRCDGDRDCEDGSDEQGCPLKTCSATEFQCQSSGTCVPGSWRCDGDTDCRDRSDEKGCDSIPCQEFVCSSGDQCISDLYVCDGDRDCKDGSDEEGCGTQQSSTQTSTQTSTETSTQTSTQTSTESSTQSSTETSTQTSTVASTLPPLECQQNEFRCSSGNQCIRRWWICDGEEDCGDGSDEDGCDVTSSSTVSSTTSFTTSTSTPAPPCGSDQIRCRLGGCILSFWRCDGERDCFDGSDEEDCNSLQCNQNEFQCASDSRCIRATWVCDGDSDCADGSDEADCSTKGPLPAAAGPCTPNPCSHICIPDSYVPKGYLCLCPIGYKMLLEEDKCVPSEEQFDEYVHDVLSKFPVQTLD